MKKKAYARLILRQLFREARQASRHMESDPSPRNVHDCRVAIRRLRTLIQVYDPLLRSRELLLIRKRLRSTAGALGRVRDPYVLRKKLSAIRLSPGGSEALARRLARDLKMEETTRVYPAQQSIRRLDSLQKRWLASVGSDDRRSATSRRYEKWTKGRLLKRRTKLMKALRDLPSINFSRLHQARIELKKYRYLLETLDANRNKRNLRAIRDAQTALGDIHDYAMLGTFVKSATRRWRIRNRHTFISEISDAIQSRIDEIYAKNERKWRGIFR